MFAKNVTISSKIEDRLTLEDYNDLKASGLTDEEILASGHFSIRDTESGRKLTGINHRGLCFKYRDPKGQPYRSQTKNFYRLKPRDWPTEVEDPPKYLSPSDAGCRPYFSALYDWKKADKTSISYFITEGEKKADCLCANNFATIGLAGVSAWRDKTPRPGESLPEGTSRPLPELSALNWEGRTAIIVFDSDVVTKWQVKRELHALALQLKKWGAFPMILLLPNEIDGSKNGADDFVVRHGIQAFNKLVRYAFPALKPAKKDEDPALNFPTDPDVNIKLPMIETVLKEDWRYRPGAGWYKWQGQYWKLTDDRGIEIEADLIDFINAQNWKEQGNGSLTTFTRHLRARLFSKIWNPGNLIAFENGTLNTKTNRFEPHHHRHDFITSLIPYEYNPEAQCPKWIEFLTQALNGAQDPQGAQETIEVIQAFFKWILVPKPDRKAEIEKCLDIVGPAGTGKGTLLDVIQALVGADNYGAIDRETFKSDPAKRSNLIDKKVSIDFDASGYVDNHGLFAKIVSNEPITAKRLYKDVFDGRLNTVIVRAYNRFLDTASGAECLDRRIIAISFDVKPKVVDPTLSEALQTELPGIFTWAWSLPHAEMKRRLMWAGKVKNIAAASVRRFEANNPEVVFLQEKYPHGSEVKQRDLYKQYKEWCLDTGHQPTKERKFFESVEQFGCTKGHKSHGYCLYSIPPMKDFDAIAYLGLVRELAPETIVPEKNFLPSISPHLPIPDGTSVSASTLFPQTFPPGSAEKTGEIHEENRGKNEVASNPLPASDREMGKNEAQKVFLPEKTEREMTAWEKLQRERGAVFYSDVPREPQFQVGQMVWWEGKEYQVEHATELRINIELPDGIIKSVQNEEIAIKNWQVGDRCFVTSAFESGEVLELCNDSLTFRVRLDSGEIAGYWANDLVLDPVALSPKTAESTVEQAIEATEVINPPPTDEGDSVKQQQAELNAFGAKLSAKYNELERLLPSKTLEAAPQTGKFKVGDRCRFHKQIGTILKIEGEDLVFVYWDKPKSKITMDQKFLSRETAEGGELLPAPRGVANYLSLKPGDRVRILRHSKHKPRWYQKGGKVVTIKATRINPKTYELEANADIEGEGLPCTLSLDAVEVVTP